jgi:hypothetical protein
MFEYAKDAAPKFNQSGRMGNTPTDESQRTVQNSAYLNTILTHFSSDKMSSSHVDFATQFPGVMVSGTNGGTGLGALGVDVESNLLWKTNPERPLEKLQLFQRPFLTVPYLGRGSCDTMLESQLMQGETVRGLKSASTVMEQNFLPLDQYPLDPEKRARSQEARYSVEELALDGWVRGGKSTRDMEENHFSNKSKPSVSGY